MNRLTAIYEETMEILRLFKQWENDEADREQLIDNIVRLIETREQLINSLQEPYTEDEIALGKQMIPLNNTLEKKMSSLFNLVKTDIKKVKEKKDLNYSYIKPYGDIKTTDGMYIDNKL